MGDMRQTEDCLSPEIKRANLLTLFKSDIGSETGCRAPLAHLLGASRIPCTLSSIHFKKPMPERKQGVKER